jgi:hypothetical protein
MKNETTNPNTNPFEYRTTPKADWELLLWSFVDRNRVDEYVKNSGLNKRQERLLLLKVFCLYLVPITVLVTLFWWLLGITLIAATDLLNITPTNWWKEGVLETWQGLPNFAAKLQYLFWQQIDALVVGLAFGLAGGLAGGLAYGLVGGLAGGLVFSLGLGLGRGLVRGLAYGLAYSLASAFTLGLSFGLVLSLKIILAFSLVLGLLYGLLYGSLYGLAFGLKFGLAVVLAVNIMYIVHYLLARLYGSRLDRNTYLIFDRIDLSLFLEQRFIAQAQENPNLAQQFIDFLWQHRPKQRNLAALLEHVVAAQKWRDKAIDLKEQDLSFPLAYEQKSFEIPTLWREQLEYIKKTSHIAQTTPQISLKVSLFKDFIAALEALHKSTLVAPQKTWQDEMSMTRRINWRTYYSDALAEWLHIAKEQYTDLQEIAKQTEPITSNQYQTGGALSLAYNSAVFMHRDDLKEKLTTLLYTTQNFSVFFLQGQRRVGKTSLLKFMPQILGNRFELVYFDLQGSSRAIPDFLEKWHSAFCAHFKLSDVEFVPKGTWSETFANMSKLFSQTAQTKNCKIILALDEYEELHKHLSKDPEQAAELLGAIRHFTQHQSEISIMFVGLQFFSELQNPNWNEYFPQSVPIKVDYLNRAKTFQLIEVSGLSFEEGMKQRIYDLTQGQPSLIQKICYELVQIANRDGRRHLTFADLDESLNTMIYISDNGVTDIFWSQNCDQAIDKEIVWAVIEQRSLPPNTRQRLRRLIEYGFILEEGNTYRMRVPIFETWVKKFG